MAISFLHPWFLVLLLAVPLLWSLPRRVRDTRLRVIRAGVFLALILALAQPVLLTADSRVHQVVIVDASPSVSAANRARERDTVAALAAGFPRGSSRSLVVVGDANWRQRPDAIDASVFDATIDLSDSLSSSSLGSALAAAGRQIPEGGRGTIHLITDGLSTDQHWAGAVQQLIERGVAVHAYDLGVDLRDVYPTDIVSRDVLRVGQTARVVVDVVGAAKGLRVRLVDAAGQEVASASPIDSTDRVSVPLTFEPKAPGFLDVTAEVTVPDNQDLNPKNNTLARTLPIQEPLRLLYLGDRMTGAAARVSQLLGRGFDVTDGSGSIDTADLSAADLVLLDDRPASKVPEAFQHQLVDAVSHQGLGFVFSGGRSAFGTGGYDGTPLASIVPVDFVQRTEKRDPSTGLAIIIDTSGSMSGTRIELAKQVARLAVRRLKAHDRIGIVEFYGNKHWALPLQSAANKVAIDRAIGRMQAIGGTVLMPAIEEAYYGLKNVDTRYKHIVIITDGGIETDDFESMVRQVAKDGINLSTVLVGSQTANQVMIDMASWGKGRFYSVVDRYNLPELILKQPSTMKLPSYKTGTFSVQSRGSEGWWSDIDRRALPPLDGYVETTTRPGAEALLEVQGSDDPILSTWRFGLGRVTALTTEPVGEGTRTWAAWRDYGRLLARVATRTADDLRLFRYNVRRHDSTVEISAQRDSRDTTLVPRASWLHDGGTTSDVAFRQIAPDQFVASIDADPTSTVRAIASAHSSSAPAAALQPTRVVSTPADEVAPEMQVDPERGLDLEALAKATNGAYTDATALAAGRLNASPAPNPWASDQASLSLWRLWPGLTVLGLLLYLAEIAYRRWPFEQRRPQASDRSVAA